MSRQSEAAADAAAEEVVADEVVAIGQGNLLSVLTNPDATAVETVQPSRAEITARIVGEMLQAQTEEELWAELPTWSTKEHQGEVFEVTGVRGVYRSKIEDANGERGWFVCFDAVRLLTGEIGILTSSAARVCGRIGWYYDHGMLPQRFEIVERGKSGAGFSILDVERAAA